MKTKAFLVAVSDYTLSGLCDINCKNDLTALRQALIKGLAVDPSDIITQGDNGVVLSSNLIDLLKIIKTCDEHDTIIFYYSGHGSNGKIHFSDRGLDLKVLIDFFKSLPQKKILIFDSCYSGQAEINHESSLDKEIELFDNNCAVLASCRLNEESGFNLEKGISLYTSFLCDAITYSPLIRKGKKRLDDIASFVSFLSTKWEEKNGLEQHPVYRSSLVGSIEFQVKEYIPYVAKDFYYECEDFIICEVKPLHLVDKKRYAVKCILRGEKTAGDISRITQLVVDIVKPLNIFANEISEKRYMYDYSEAKIIWCYWGYDEEDICYCTWAFRSTWVNDDQDKTYWYKENDKSKVMNNVLVITESHYDFVRSMRYSNIDEQEFISETNQYMEDLINCARKYIQIYREGENGTISENDRRILLEPLSHKIAHTYYKLGNLPAFFISLQKWFDERFSIASYISDMALFYQGNNYNKWSNKDRDYLINKAISNYQIAYDALQSSLMR